MSNRKFLRICMDRFDYEFQDIPKEYANLG